MAEGGEIEDYPEMEGEHEYDEGNIAHNDLDRESKLIKEWESVHGKMKPMKPKMASGGYIPNPTEAQARAGYPKRKRMAEGGGLMDSVSKLAPIAMMLAADGGKVAGRDSLSTQHGDDVEMAMDEVPENDDGLMKACARECMTALKNDNEHEFLEALRAIVLSMKE